MSCNCVDDNSKCRGECHNGCSGGSCVDDDSKCSGCKSCSGGTLYVESCSPDIDNCDFDNNQASGASSQSYGGAIYTNNSGATFDYCEIGTNSALNNSASHEIYTYGSTRPTYTNCTIRGWTQDSPCVDGDYMDYNVFGPYGSNNSDF